MLSGKYIKIANEIYTYLKSAVQEENQQTNIDTNKLFDQLKRLLLSHKQVEFCQMLNRIQSNKLNKILNKRDSKQYSLFMIAASNNLSEAVKCLIQKNADIYLTITCKGHNFRTIFNSKLKNNQLTDQQIQHYNNIKIIQANAYDIAIAKGNNKVVSQLKNYFY